MRHSPPESARHALVASWHPSPSFDVEDNINSFFFFFPAADGIRDPLVTGVQTCALPICSGTGNGGDLLDRYSEGDQIPAITRSAAQPANRAFQVANVRKLGAEARQSGRILVEGRSEERRVGKEDGGHVLQWSCE